MYLNFTIARQVELFSGELCEHVANIQKKHGHCCRHFHWPHTPESVHAQNAENVQILHRYQGIPEIMFVQ